MKIIRYTDANNQIKFASLQPDNSALEIYGDIFSTFTITNRKATVKKLLAPLDPYAILCIGLNYKKHAHETKSEIPQYPILFLKNPSSVQNPGDPILLPTALKSTKVDYEVELVIVIGKTCKNVSTDKSLDYILGYTCGNDVSARDWQKFGGGGQWCLAKTFDTFAPLGPCIVTTDEIPDPNSLSLKTTVNDRVLQESNTADMIFSVAEIVSFLSKATTLRPGTVIFTGTPEGVGMGRNPYVWLQDGDQVTVEIEKIGSLTNPVELEK